MSWKCKYPSKISPVKFSILKLVHAQPLVITSNLLEVFLSIAGSSNTSQAR